MKKIITLVILTITANVIFAQGGRIKVYFAGFDCYRETWDDILHTDGKGDEVFFNFAFTLGDKNGNSKLSYEKRTSVYGDATGQFSNRISVGSFVDLFGNNKGGIKAGDTYRCNDLLGEYDMADGDILTVIPVGWEHDPIADNSIAFQSTLRGLYQSINQKLAPIMIGFSVLTGDLGGIIYHAGSLGLSSIKAGGNQGELGRPGTRPIGMEKYGDFSPKLVALNTPNLSKIATSNFGFGNGVINVNYDEVALGNTRDHGNYTILLKVEFTPNAVAPAPAPKTTIPPPPPPPPATSIPPPPPPPPATSIPPSPVPAPQRIIKPGKQINPNTKGSATAIMNNEFLTGVWKGTMGNGNSATDGPYSFKFLNNAFWMLANNGSAVAAGGYQISNGNFIANYIDTNTNYNYTVSSTAYNNTSTELSGTWTCTGSNYYRTGKWVVKKVSN